MKYILAIDQGTSSCRAVLVNHKAEIVASAQKEFTQIFPQSGWVEHDANEIWSVQEEMIQKVIEDNKIDPNDIAGIGITNQRETTVVWDKTTGEPICNAIVWQDKRTAEYCKSIRTEHESYFKENAGLPLDPYFSGTKLRWILQEHGYNENYLFGTIDTWLIWKMTGGKNHVTDYTNASRTLMYNIRSKTWDKKILDILAVPKQILPLVQASASHFGTYEINGHQIPITGVAGDQQSALFGQACFEPGDIKNTYGTGCFMLMNIGTEFKQSKNGLLTTICCDQAGQPIYALEGSVFVTGAAVQWLRDGLKIINSSQDTEEMAFSVRDDYNVMIVPAFAGLGAPYWDMDARGAIYGLTRATNSNHIAKATLESIAYRTRDVIEAMIRDANIDVPELNVDGGATANKYLMQFQADILGKTVVRPENTESTVMGAAYLSGLTLEMWDADYIKGLRKIDKTFEPSMDSSFREKLYTNWKAAIKRTISA